MGDTNILLLRKICNIIYMIKGYLRQKYVHTPQNTSHASICCIYINGICLVYNRQGTMSFRLNRFIIFDILVTCGKPLHGRIISLRGEVQDQLNPVTFIEMPVPRQEIERSCICVLGYRCSLFLWLFSCVLEVFRR